MEFANARRGLGTGEMVNIDGIWDDAHLLLLGEVALEVLVEAAVAKDDNTVRQLARDALRDEIPNGAKEVPIRVKSRPPSDVDDFFDAGEASGHCSDGSTPLAVDYEHIRPGPAQGENEHRQANDELTQRIDRKLDMGDSHVLARLGDNPVAAVDDHPVKRRVVTEAKGDHAGAAARTIEMNEVSYERAGDGAGVGGDET